MLFGIYHSAYDENSTIKLGKIMRYEVKNEGNGVTIAEFLHQSDCYLFITALMQINPHYARDLKVNEIKIDILN